MTNGDKEKVNFLTETILSIHNEIQSALDYISTKATEDGTEFGKSTAILSIQNLRIKLPIRASLDVEEEYHADDAPSQPAGDNSTPPSDSGRATDDSFVSIRPTASLLNQSLLQRQGFIVQEAAVDPQTLNIIKDSPTVTTKLCIDLEPPVQQPTQNTADQPAQKDVWGELEITFSPIKRQ